MSSAKDLIYLDNHATTRIDPRVLDAMMPSLRESYGNAASRTHAYGWEAEAMVDKARGQMARAIGARPSEIVFTSGATEAINLALKGLFEAHGQVRRHGITLSTEHKATLDTCRALEARGMSITVLGVGRDGLVDLQRLMAAMTDQTLFVSVMAVQNEIGVIQPIAEIGKACRERGIYFHTDAAQAVGKIPIDVERMNIDLLSLSGHKFYAPKGVGCLFVREKGKRVEIHEQQNGGHHEGGRRSGTLNVPGIVGLGAAAEFVRAELAVEAPRIRALRDRLEATLEKSLEDVFVNGHRAERVPGNLNMGFRHIEGEGLLVALPKIAVSSGSACTSSSVAPSYVLKAIGLSDDDALSSIRFGIGRFTTDAEIDIAAEVVADTVRKLRAMAAPGKTVAKKAVR